MITSYFCIIFFFIVVISFEKNDNNVKNGIFKGKINGILNNKNYEYDFNFNSRLMKNSIQIN